MNRSSRIAAREKRTDGPLHEGPIDLLSEESMRRVFEERRLSSENRWEKVASHAAVLLCRKACASLKARKQLAVKVVTKPDRCPEIQPSFRFKYSGSRRSGSLGEAVERMRCGEKTTLAWIEEDGSLVGYGFAVKVGNIYDIKIIDVDVDSRRSSGLSYPFAVEGEKFTVGVGHLVVGAIIKKYSGPFCADATNSSSRYIFRSLGFAGKKGCDNPCLLELKQAVRKQA